VLSLYCQHMDDLIFRSVKDLDGATVRRIVLIDNSIPSEFDSSWQPTEEDHQARIKQITSMPVTDFFKVVFLKGEIVGFHGISQGKGPKKNLGMINTLWVHPNLRNRGLCKTLKLMGIEWAEDQKLEYLQTSVHSNNARMMKINLGSGFEPYAVTLRYKL
jgi:RimJ/RimL family protein N-acetyltransferase